MAVLTTNFHSGIAQTLEQDEAMRAQQLTPSQWREALLSNISDNGYESAFTKDEVNRFVDVIEVLNEPAHSPLISGEDIIRLANESTPNINANIFSPIFNVQRTEKGNYDISIGDIHVGKVLSPTPSSRPTTQLKLNTPYTVSRGTSSISIPVVPGQTARDLADSLHGRAATEYIEHLARIDAAERELVDASDKDLGEAPLTGSKAEFEASVSLLLEQGSDNPAISSLIKKVEIERNAFAFSVEQYLNTEKLQQNPSNALQKLSRTDEQIITVTSSMNTKGEPSLSNHEDEFKNKLADFSTRGYELLTATELESVLSAARTLQAETFKSPCVTPIMHATIVKPAGTQTIKVTNMSLPSAWSGNDQYETLLELGDQCVTSAEKAKSCFIDFANKADFYSQRLLSNAELSGNVEASRIANLFKSQVVTPIQQAMGTQSNKLNAVQVAQGGELYSRESIAAGTNKRVQTALQQLHQLTQRSQGLPESMVSTLNEANNSLRAMRHASRFIMASWVNNSAKVNQLAFDLACNNTENRLGLPTQFQSQLDALSVGIAACLKANPSYAFELPSKDDFFNNKAEESPVISWLNIEDTSGEKFNIILLDENGSPFDQFEVSDLNELDQLFEKDVSEYVGALWATGLDEIDMSQFQAKHLGPIREQTSQYFDDVNTVMKSLAEDLQTQINKDDLQNGLLHLQSQGFNAKAYQGLTYFDDTNSNIKIGLTPLGSKAVHNGATFRCSLQAEASTKSNPTNTSFSLLAIEQARVASQINQELNHSVFATDSLKKVLADYGVNPSSLKQSVNEWVSEVYRASAETGVNLSSAWEAYERQMPEVYEHLKPLAMLVTPSTGKESLEHGIEMVHCEEIASTYSAHMTASNASKDLACLGLNQLQRMAAIGSEEFVQPVSDGHTIQAAAIEQGSYVLTPIRFNRSGGELYSNPEGELQIHSAAPKVITADPAELYPLSTINNKLVELGILNQASTDNAKLATPELKASLAALGHDALIIKVPDSDFVWVTPVSETNQVTQYEGKQSELKVLKTQSPHSGVPLTNLGNQIRASLSLPDKALYSSSSSFVCENEGEKYPTFKPETSSDEGIPYLLASDTPLVLNGNGPSEELAELAEIMQQAGLDIDNSEQVSGVALYQRMNNRDANLTNTLIKANGYDAVIAEDSASNPEWFVSLNGAAKLNLFKAKFDQRIDALPNETKHLIEAIKTGFITKNGVNSGQYLEKMGKQGPWYSPIEKAYQFQDSLHPTIKKYSASVHVDGYPLNVLYHGSGAQLEGTGFDGKVADSNTATMRNQLTGIDSGFWTAPDPSDAVIHASGQSGMLNVMLPGIQEHEHVMVLNNGQLTDEGLTTLDIDSLAVLINECAKVEGAPPLNSAMIQALDGKDILAQLHQVENTYRGHIGQQELGSIIRQTTQLAGVVETSEYGTVINELPNANGETGKILAAVDKAGKVHVTNTEFSPAESNWRASLSSMASSTPNVQASIYQESLNKLSEQGKMPSVLYLGNLIEAQNRHPVSIAETHQVNSGMVQKRPELRVNPEGLRGVEHAKLQAITSKIAIDGFAALAPELKEKLTPFIPNLNVIQRHSEITGGSHNIQSNLDTVKSVLHAHPTLQNEICIALSEHASLQQPITNIELAGSLSAFIEMESQFKDPSSHVRTATQNLTHLSPEQLNKYFNGINNTLVDLQNDKYSLNTSAASLAVSVVELSKAEPSSPHYNAIELSAATNVQRELNRRLLVAAEVHSFGKQAIPEARINDLIRNQGALEDINNSQYGQMLATDIAYKKRNGEQYDVLISGETFDGQVVTIDLKDINLTTLAKILPESNVTKQMNMLIGGMGEKINKDGEQVTMRTLPLGVEGSNTGVKVIGIPLSMLLKDATGQAGTLAVLPTRQTELVNVQLNQVLDSVLCVKVNELNNPDAQLKLSQELLRAAVNPANHESSFEMCDISTSTLLDNSLSAYATLVKDMSLQAPRGLDMAVNALPQELQSTDIQSLVGLEAAINGRVAGIEAPKMSNELSTISPQLTESSQIVTKEPTELEHRLNPLQEFTDGIKPITSQFKRGSEGATPKEPSRPAYPTPEI